MGRRQQPTRSSSSDSDGPDVESCFDIEREETDAETEPTDIDTDINRDGDTDLPDLKWVAG
jgi:hypothetical protein